MLEMELDGSFGVKVETMDRITTFRRRRGSFGTLRDKQLLAFPLDRKHIDITDVIQSGDGARNIGHGRDLGDELAAMRQQIILPGNHIGLAIADLEDARTIVRTTGRVEKVESQKVTKINPEHPTEGWK